MADRTPRVADEDRASRTPPQPAAGWREVIARRRRRRRGRARRGDPHQRPADAFQEVVFHTPLAIVVLIVGTGWLLWRISRRTGSPSGERAGVATPAPASACIRRFRDPPRAAGPTSGRHPALTSTTWDVVIVGGGIVGVGALLDAVSRGLRAALIEQDDIAAGTSSRSSRLIHGGLRYLEQFRFGLVREALAERSSAAGAGAASRPDRAPAVPDLRDPLRLEGVLRRRPDAVRHPRRPPRRRLARAALARGDARAAPRRCGRRVCAAASSITTGSRTTLATRWPWLEPRSPPAAWRSPGSARPGSGRRRPAAIDGASGDRPHDRRRPRDPDRGGRGRDRACGRPSRATRSGAARCGSCPAAARTSSCHAIASRTQMGLTIRVPGKIVFLVPWPDHWLIGTTDAPYEGPAARPSARRLGGRQAARHGQRDDGRRPDAGRCGRHVRRAAAADRAVGRVDGQGVARASHHGRRPTASSGSAAASTRRTG